MSNKNIDLSVVIPIKDEEKNIPILVDELLRVLSEIGGTYEIIFVDDASSDNSSNTISEITRNNSTVQLVQLAVSAGQTMAIAAGIEQAAGDVIVLMDGDLQNDPDDIPRLLKKIEDGYDVVSGWRKKRKDPFLTRILPSITANMLIRYISGIKLHDFGCTLKAYKSELLKNIDLLSETHRLLPLYAAMAGAKITEIEVNHRPRRYGKTKYSLTRVFKVILDVFIARFFALFSTKPIYMFGGCGLVSLCISFLIGLIVIVRYFLFTKVWVSPLLFVSIMLFSIGIQFLLMGVLAEILIRIYFTQTDNKPYIIKKHINS